MGNIALDSRPVLGLLDLFLLDTVWWHAYYSYWSGFYSIIMYATIIRFGGGWMETETVGTSTVYGRI